MQKFKNAFSGIKLNRTEIMLLSIICGFAATKIFINLINPPFGWDDLNYHFTFPVEWIKNHNLVNPMVVSCDPSPTYYPINGSFFYAWFIMPLKNVFVADLGQLPFFVMAFFAVYSLGRKLNLPRQYAFFAAALFSLVPNYFKQISIAYVDVMVAALFLAALNYLFLLYEQGSLLNTALFSICVGLMIGIKTTSLPFAVLLLIPFMHFIFKNLGFSRMVFLAVSCFALLVITGGFSYIRNIFETGNPLYPLNFKIYDWTIFKGVMDSAVYRAHVSPQDYNLGKILFSEGLGAQTVLFLLPGILLGLPLAISRNKKGIDFNRLYFLILPFLLILAYRFVIPLPNLRYIYCLLGIGSIISFYVVVILNLPKRIINILVIVCALVSMAELAKRGELVISILLSAALFFLLPAILKRVKAGSILKYSIIVLLIAFVCLVLLEADYVRNEHGRYSKMVKYSGFWPDATKAWQWLDRNTAGNNVAYIGRPVPFPLYGTNFKNNVYYVSVNKTDPAKLHYYPDSRYAWGYEGEGVHKSFEERNNYRGMADYSIWLSNLRRRNTDYLFVYSLHQIKGVEFPIEDRWATEHPEIFDLAARFDTIHIYKIIKKNESFNNHSGP